MYHNGESEPFLGWALSGGYCEKVNLATKLPVWVVEKREDMDRVLTEQLMRLQTDHIDFYLLHGLNNRMWNRALNSNVREILGRGFSIHVHVLYSLYILC